MTGSRIRAPRNRTLNPTPSEMAAWSRQLIRPHGKPFTSGEIENKLVLGDLAQVVDLLPDAFVDLMIVDPPYNLSKDFHGTRFSAMNDESYRQYLASWFPKLMRLLKPGATVYLCGDWKCSAAEYEVMRQHLTVRNRITWQREKGRGARTNWKNASEDIWFGTAGPDYYFNVDAVKMKRKVVAPYRENGRPKDWQESGGEKFRRTCPSNFWDDISIPYWSMPENTDHPTQKPEKLIAKLILASSREGDFVFDPFAGSGTTAVAAKKLGRRFLGVEINETYCCWGQARLERAESAPAIQGYADGVFWERNTQLEQDRARQFSQP